MFLYIVKDNQHIGNLYADSLFTSANLHAKQRLIEIDQVSLERLLPSGHDPKRCLVVGAVLSHVVEHQLCHRRAVSGSGLAVLAAERTP